MNSRRAMRTTGATIAAVAVLAAGLVASAAVSEPALPQGTPLPQQQSTPFTRTGLLSASDSYVAITNRQPEEGSPGQLAIHRISDGTLVRTIVGNREVSETSPRLIGSSIVQLSASKPQGFIDTLTTTAIESGASSTLTFPTGRPIGFGPGWVLACSAGSSYDQCPLELRRASGVTVLGQTVSNPRTTTGVEAVSSPTRAVVVSGNSGEQWAVDAVAGTIAALPYPEAFAVTGGRAFWQVTDYANGTPRTILHWRNVDGTGDGSVVVQAPAHQNDLRAYGSRVALLRWSDDGSFERRELVPISLTDGSLGPVVARSVQNMVSLTNGRVVIASADTATGRLRVGTDGQPLSTLLDFAPIGKHVIGLSLSAGHVAATWGDGAPDDETVHYASTSAGGRWSTTGPSSAPGAADPGALGAPSYAVDASVTEVSPRGTSSSQTRYRVSWGRGSREVVSALGPPRIGRGQLLMTRQVPDEATGSIARIEIQDLRTGAVKLAVPRETILSIDGSKVWSMPAQDSGVLASFDTATGQTSQRAVAERCVRQLTVVGSWAMVDCENRGAFVQDLQKPTGSWQVPVAAGDESLRLGNGFVAWGRPQVVAGNDTHVIKVAGLSPAHEVRTYGPARALSFTGPTLSPDGSGQPLLAYVDGAHQPRLLDVAWAVPAPEGDRTAPRLTTWGAASSLLTTVGGTATFSYGATDEGGAVRYTVAQRTHTGKGFGPWIESGTTATSVSAAVAGGTTTCFRVKASDAVGNSTAWSAESCSTAPLDDRSLAAKGGVKKQKDGAAMNRTVSTLTRKKASLVARDKRLHGVYVLARKGPKEGAVAVYVGRTRLGTVNLKSSKKGFVRVLVRSTAERSGDVRIVSTSKRPARVDGLALLP